MKTPYYLYDTSLLERTLDEALTASRQIASSHIHYAVKANPNPRILKIIADRGLGADCVSGGEIEAALQAGFAAKDIFYAGVGKTDEEIMLGLRQGIGCFNVESLEELKVISFLASSQGRTATVAIRVNPNIGAHTHAGITTGLAENKFGINLEQLPSVVEAASLYPGLELAGLHFHIGSQILDMTDFQALCNRINEILTEFAHSGVHFRSINVGGGLGVDYRNPELHPVPDFDAYFACFASHLHLEPSQRFHCELGRSIVAQCGSLITRCIYVKEGSVKKFVIVDAGMNDLVRPAMYGAYHKIENLTAAASSKAEDTRQLYDVVGPVCESSDCFAKGIYLPGTQRGDLLAIRSAGAYGESMASTYNSRRLPESIFE